MSKSTDQTKPFYHMCAALALCSMFITAIPALAQEAEPAAPEYMGMGANICLGCHGPGSSKPVHEQSHSALALRIETDAPVDADKLQCEACHGPSKAHVMAGGQSPVGNLFNAAMSSEEKNAACLGCHETGELFHWPGATHNIEDVACVDCHQVHAAEDPVRVVETQTEVCFQCHKEQRAQFLRQSRHPVQAAANAYSHTGLLACTDCHNPHGSDGPAQLKRSTVNETCYDCHAEKRGPFLWEHAPVGEDCSNCHTPHGSNYPNLLVGRTPWLCQQCHSTPFHPSTAYSGIDLPPESIDQRVVGKDCMNCHQKVHGSNHPSGIRLTR